MTPPRLPLATLCVTLSILCACATDSALDQADLARRIQGIYDPGISDRFSNDGLIINPFDLNNDGTADMWRVFIPTQKFLDGKESIRLVRKEVDTNFDGRVDLWMLYNDQELLKEQHADPDFDGVVNQREVFEKGQLVRRDIFTSGFPADAEGTHPNARKHYKSNRLFKIELDPDADGLINRREVFINGRLTQIGEDKDGDGRVDFWQEAEGANR